MSNSTSSPEKAKMVDSVTEKSIIAGNTFSKKRKFDVYKETKEEDSTINVEAGKMEEEKKEDEWWAEMYKEVDPEIQAKLDKFCSEEREMNHEELAIYNKMVIESEGFDAPYFPKCAEFGQILPLVRLENCIDRLVFLSNKALDKYNVDNGFSYHFKRVVKANMQIHPAGILFFYITFEATNIRVADVAPETFQAKVFDGMPPKGIKILMIRKISVPK